jgi:catechol 2,3-dioxygenase-like lactoylglutathione lyase family enzyme
MATGIDHVVIAVDNLDQAIADFTTAGFTVVSGGTHANGETQNALVAFGDGSYFELIAWLDPATASRTPWRIRLDDGEGLVDFAVRSADLEDEVKRLRAEGLDTPDPTPGGRIRPDGERVEWLTLRFDADTHPWLPFYCHSTNDRSLRVPSGVDAVHPNGATGIAAITIGVRDLTAAERDFAILAGIEYTPDATATSREFAIGTTRIILVTDQDDAALAGSIGRRGQVPVAVELHTTGDTTGPIDAQLTHGAAISLVS